MHVLFVIYKIVAAIFFFFACFDMTYYRSRDIGHVIFGELRPSWASSLHSDTEIKIRAGR